MNVETLAREFYTRNIENIPSPHTAHIIFGEPMFFACMSTDLILFSIDGTKA